MKTITGREIKVTPNNSKRTFTIRVTGSKYRTLQMSKEEFRSAQFWTGNDWQNFLKTDEYYKVERKFRTPLDKLITRSKQELKKFERTGILK